MNESQILLLPEADYWTWVEAAKGYAAKFGSGLTPSPEEAAHYRAPGQTVTIGGLAGAYGAQGDIQHWFRAHYPEIRLDYLACQSAQDFQAALQARLAANERYLSPAGLRLRWPTDYGLVNQGFGGHPEIYRRWNLPGNDGLDLFAPMGAKVYAAAEGQVAGVESYTGDPAKGPDGNAVTLKHAGGFSTRYMHLEKVLVKAGQAVSAGQTIGLAGATGSAGAAQLHFVLTQAGATAARRTDYPRDIVDPTPFMQWPQPLATPAAGNTYNWPPGYCLVGLHGRTDGPLQDADYPPAGQARVEAVKLLSSAQASDLDRLRAMNPKLFFLVRMFAAFDGRHVSSADFASWMTGDLAPFYSRGVRYFEVHNEPNLVPEGWTQSWSDGAAFGAWFVDVVNRLRPVFPEARFGFPGLSPGDDVPGLRSASWDFLTGADAACRAADWVGVHCYWVSEADMNSTAGGLGFADYRARFPGKLLFITEFSNPTPDTDKPTKGGQYQRYYKLVRALPGVGAAFSFVVSASNGYGAETWRDESGAPTQIPSLVGARSGTISGTPPPP
jgi:murein DD-endopeptidase MepM/ murein hydrolase activator NlpD